MDDWDVNDWIQVVFVVSVCVVIYVIVFLMGDLLL